MTKKDLLELVSQHAGTVRAILDDNLVSGGDLSTEIEAALENLRNDIDNEDLEADAEPETDLELELQSLGIVQRQKLEDFLRSEIYPHYNQQKNSLLL